MNDVYQILDDLEIEYEKYEHPAVYTVEEAERYDRGDADTGHSKNLLLRNKKGDNHYLVILEGSKRLNLKELAKDLNESDVSFASPERLMKYLGLTPGSVSPFGLVNDYQKEVHVVVDSSLLRFKKQGSHPNTNTATLVFSTDNFKKFLEWTGNKVDYIDIK